MAFVAILAKRFLTGKKRNTFISFISGVSLFGVCLGVAALAVVMSVMEGFESELRSVITGTHSHIALYSSKQIIPNPYELEQRIRKAEPEIEAVSPYIFSEVMLAHKSRVVGSMVEGIQENTLRQTTQVARHLSQGEFPRSGHEPTVVLGAVVADKLSAKIGDTISVISPFFDKGTLQPRSKRFQVSGLLHTGMYEYDSKYSMITMEEASQFFRLPEGSASAFKIKTKDPEKSYLISKKLKKELGYPYVARDWTELNKNLLYAIKLQKAVIFLVLTAIIVVAAFNIMSTLVMMMSEKKREMSILKAMGMARKQSAAIFISVGSIIGGAGAVAGIALGLLLSQILAHTSFIDLPPDIYFFSYLPVDVRPITLVIVGGCAMVVALLATIYPAYRVAVESPVEGLRYE